MKHYDNDPEKGGKEISIWEDLERSGAIEQLKKRGVILYPWHDYELLKSARWELFIKERQKFIEERNLNKLKTTELHLKLIYIAWLKRELEIIEQLLSDKTPSGKEKSKPTFSEQIEILKYEQYVKAEIESTENKINLPQQSEYIQPKQSQFSVLEWATIFYYADETKLLPESRTIKARIEQFINKYEIDTTFKYFKTQYYEAKKRINKKNDYPINKLELIIPFLKENYKQTVTKIENDITFLESEQTDY